MYVCMRVRTCVCVDIPISFQTRGGILEYR